jgi:hypothetical protein
MAGITTEQIGNNVVTSEKLARSVDIASLSVGGTAVTSTAAELNAIDGVPATITITHSAGAANIVNVTFTVKDANGTALDLPTLIDVWLSDAATGLAVTTHAADTITASTGSIFHTYTTGISFRLQTSATGVATLVVTDTHKTAYYACAALGIDARPTIHLLATGDYGA